MKVYFLAFLFLSTSIYSQKTVTKYLQLTANVDLLGNISMMPVPLLKSKKGNLDSSINYTPINLIINKYKSPVLVMNELSLDGWMFISSLFINKDENGRPNSPILVYYFKKEFNE